MDMVNGHKNTMWIRALKKSLPVMQPIIFSSCNHNYFQHYKTQHKILPGSSSLTPMKVWSFAYLLSKSPTYLTTPVKRPCTRTLSPFLMCLFRVDSFCMQVQWAVLCSTNLQLEQEQQRPFNTGFFTNCTILRLLKLCAVQYLYFSCSIPLINCDSSHGLCVASC